MGFFFETRLATSANDRPSLRSSMCIAIAWVASSCSKNVSRSSSVVSALLPRPDDRRDAHLCGTAEPDDRHPDAAALQDSATEPLTSYGVQNVAHRSLGR